MSTTTPVAELAGASRPRAFATAGLVYVAVRPWIRFLPGGAGEG